MDYQIILNLMKEMNQSDLTKLEIEDEGLRICIEKNPSVITTVATALAPQANVNTPTAPAAVIPSPTPVTASVDTTQMVEEEGKIVLSPMVGTFYAQASPEKPPFAKVGDQVKKGQTLCIIEAMKLMNEIESEHDGEIIKVLVQNEDMVQFGQPLFVIK